MIGEGVCLVGLSTRPLGQIRNYTKNYAKCIDSLDKIVYNDL